MQAERPVQVALFCVEAGASLLTVELGIGIGSGGKNALFILWTHTDRPRQEGTSVGPLPSPDISGHLIQKSQGWSHDAGPHMHVAAPGQGCGKGGV